MLCLRNSPIVLMFGMVDASTNAAITTGTVSGYISQDGGAQTAIGDTPVHLGNGQWSAVITDTEMDAGTIGLVFTHASGTPVYIYITTYTELPANVTSLNGTAVVASAGYIGATLKANAINSTAVDPSAVTEIQSGLATSAALATVAGYVDTEISTLLSRIPQAFTFSGGLPQVSVTDVSGNSLAGNTGINIAQFFAAGGGLSTSTLLDIDTVKSNVDAIKVRTDKLTFNLSNEVYCEVSTVASAFIDSTTGNNFATLFGNGGSASTFTVGDLTTLTSNYTAALAADLDAFVSNGRGANVVTVTVRDSVAAPLQGAIVRLSEGANSFTATTNASGVATFALDNATYTRSVTKAGYVAAPDSITVTGAGNFNLSMSATGSVSAPADPSMCRVYGYLIKPDGSIASNVTVKFKLQTGGPATSGSVIATREISAATNGAGLLEVDLIRNDVITPDGSYYTISCKEVEFPHPQRLELSTPTYNLSDLV